MSHLPWSEHYDASIHNPIFQQRNHNKRLEVETILSKFRTQMYMAYQTEDQAGFDDICKRVKRAGEGLEVKEPSGEDLYSKTVTGKIDNATKDLREAIEAAKK